MIPGTPDEYKQRELFQKELLDGETIQWVGQPDPSVIFSPADLFLVPFSLLWGGFAVFWEVSVLFMMLKSDNAGAEAVPFALFGIPFVLFGLYFIFGRFIYKAWKKRRTYYAVTDKRIIILTLGRGRNVQAMFIHDIPVVNKRNGGRGTGTIIFGNSFWPALMQGNTGMDWMGAFYGTFTTVFYDIKGADTVYNLVNQLRNQQ